MEVRVNSEIGRLRKVLLHRPGRELENLTPDTLERLLFDDIPWLELAQKEHDEFSGILRGAGVKVYYIENLVSEAIENPDAKKEFLEKFINEAIETNNGIVNQEDAKKKLRRFLEKFKNNKELVDFTIAGVRTTEISEVVEMKDGYFFIADPLPNLYFQRDPFATIGDGVSINHMYSVTRNRETLYAYIMFKYHPEFKKSTVKHWYGRDLEYAIEGGDQLVINDSTLLVGISQRTKEGALPIIAKNLYDQGSKINKVIGFNIGECRAFMHLDTVFTQVDRDKFTVHPDAVNEKMVIKIFTVGESGVEEKTINDLTILEVLEEATGMKVQLLECGGGDPIAAAREQWNDGANTLAIAPGEVVVYSRNPVTNELLENAGIKIHVMSSSELSRGRGGPRCMSMPLERDEI